MRKAKESKPVSLIEFRLSLLDKAVDAMRDARTNLNMVMQSEQDAFCQWVFDWHLKVVDAAQRDLEECARLYRINREPKEEENSGDND